MQHVRPPCKPVPPFWSQQNVLRRKVPMKDGGSLDVGGLWDGVSQAQEASSETNGCDREIYRVLYCQSGSGLFVACAWRVETCWNPHLGACDPSTSRTCPASLGNITLTWQLCNDVTGLGSTQFYGREVQLGQLATWCLSSSCSHLRWTNILDWMLKSDNKIRRAWPDHASRPMLGKCFLRSLGVFLQKALVVQTLPKSFLCNSTGQTESTVCCHHAVALLTQADSGTLRPLRPAGIHCSFRISYIKSEWTAKQLEVWKSN